MKDYPLGTPITYVMGSSPKSPRITATVLKVENALLNTPLTNGNVAMEFGAKLTLSNNTVIVKCTKPGCLWAAMTSRQLVGHLGGHTRKEKSLAELAEMVAVDQSASERPEEPEEPEESEYTPEYFGKLGMSLEDQALMIIDDLRISAKNLEGFLDRIKRLDLGTEDLEELREKANRYDDMERVVNSRVISS